MRKNEKLGTETRKKQNEKIKEGRKEIGTIKKKMKKIIKKD